MSATDSTRRTPPSLLVAAVTLGFVLAAAQVLTAQDERGDEAGESASKVRQTMLFLGGVTSGLALHEAGHLLFDVAFDADPAVRRVEFGGVPFFAITHRGDLSPRREYAVSAAGFWVQYAFSEGLLTREPGLRRGRRPFGKGLLAFHLLSSTVYAIAAAGRIGPPERDTRGMARSLDISERWVGVMVMAPAAFDVVRYIHPECRWARWLSRLGKAGVAAAVVAAGGR